MIRSGCLAAFACLLLVACVVSGAESESTVDKCAQFSRCSSCLYDAGGEFLAEERFNCFWCPKEGRCTSNKTCAAFQSRTHNAQCEDMNCAAVRNTGNIYLCRGGLQVALLFSVALLIISFFFFIWVRCIQQLPWRFQNVHDVIDRHLQRDGSAVAAAFNSFKGPDDLALEAIPELVSSCPMCRVKYPERTFAPGEACYWCSVGRLAFFPFAVGLVTSSSVTFLLLAASIRPWFMDIFAALSLIIGYAAYIVFIAGVLKFHEVDGHGVSTMYFQLSIILRGRSYRSVYKHKIAKLVVPTTEEEEAREQLESPKQGPSLTKTQVNFASSMSLGDHEMAPPQDQMQLLELDNSVSAEFRKRLLDDLKSDEYILWWENSSPYLLFIDNSWLLGGFAHLIVFGFWSFFVGGIPASQYPKILWSPGMMRFIGLFSVGFGIFMFALVFIGCHRLYVLTNKRLFILTTSLLGSLSVNVQPLALVKGAWVYGYEMFGNSILSFEYEIDDGLKRRLPRLKNTKFIGVQHMDLLLKRFHEYAPSIDHSDNLKEELQHLRRVWCMHTLIAFYAMAILPIVFVYTELFPFELGSFGLTLAHGICIIVITRALRVQMTTTVPLTVSRAWSRFSERGFSFTRFFAFNRRGKRAHLPAVRQSAMKNVASVPNMA